MFLLIMFMMYIFIVRNYYKINICSKGVYYSYGGKQVDIIYIYIYIVHWGQWSREV